MKTATDTSPRLFLTDYGSYNNGSQFEFGHWLDIDQFTDASDLLEYIRNHFEEADKKSPLPGGSPRDETMFTDFEGFPRSFYGESMGEGEVQALLDFINLDDDDKLRVTYLMENISYDFSEAMEHKDDVYVHEDDRDTIYDLFEQYFPDAAKAEETCDFLEINYDRFVEMCFTKFEYEGERYLIEYNG